MLQQAHQADMNQLTAQHTAATAEIDRLHQDHASDLDVLRAQHAAALGEYEGIQRAHNAELELLNRQHAAALSDCQSQQQAQLAVQDQKRSQVSDAVLLAYHCKTRIWSSLLRALAIRMLSFEYSRSHSVNGSVPFSSRGQCVRLMLL